MDDVLVVFPSVFSLNKIKKLIESIKKKIELKFDVNKITTEKSCLVFEVDDVVDAAVLTADIFGIEKVAIAKRIPNEFKKIVTTIVNTGKKTILPGEQFFVRVQADYPETVGFTRSDIEFTSTGDLAAELSDISAHPAKNEYEATKIIFSYIGRESTYVCIHIYTGVGGLPFGSQNKKVACSIHNVLSATSCLMAVKCGYLPQILIVYSSEPELKENIRLFGSIAHRTSINTLKIRVTHIDLSDDLNGNIRLMLQESIAIKILTVLPERNIILPLSASIHPFWFVEAIKRRTLFAGKTPFMPLLFLTDSIYHTVDDMHLKYKKQDINMLINNAVFKKEAYEKYQKKIDALSKDGKKNIKTISLKIGPNYLHDIIDSI